MILSDFTIGCEFAIEGRTHRWRCTDIGSRVVVAILILKSYDTDKSWCNGPPYAIVEHVFDENDLPVCQPLEESENGRAPRT